jgi:hypothetical protein
VSMAPSVIDPPAFCRPRLYRGTFGWCRVGRAECG